MRGPLDDAINAREAPEAAVRDAESVEPRRPPGGKALSRLLLLLDSAGYTQVADETVEAAVGGQLKTEVRRMTSAAPAEGARTSARTARRRVKSKEEGAEPQADQSGGAASASPAEIGELYLEAATMSPESPPTATGPQWRSLGPWTIPNGQTYGASRVNVSGRISAIAIDPSNAAHVLVGAANGGVWETKDSGGSWAPRTDFASTLAIGAITFDPQNPHVVYCGTGEGNWWSFLGAGVLRSTDGGTSWTVRCTAPFVGQGFYDLIVNPTNSNHLLAATTAGLFTSVDAGATWTQRRTARTWSLAIHPAGGASAEILAACQDGLFRSVNGGATWTAVTLPATSANWDRLAVAISRTNPGVAYAWGSFRVPPSTVSAPILQRRSGGTWSVVAPPPGVAVTQAWYDWFLAIAPDRDTQIYCGAIEVHRGDLSGSTWSWINLTNKGTTGDSIHPDQHAIAFKPGDPNTIYVGNDGGMYRSANRGINWQHLNNGLVISEFEYIAQDFGTTKYILGGTQDNGTERFRGSPTWDHVADGDGGDCGVNRTLPNNVFHTFYDMSPERSGSAGNFGSWTWIAPTIDPFESAALFYPPFECSATTGDTIAIGGGSLYVSRNNGTAWTRLPFPAPLTSSAIYIPNANTVYVGTTRGNLYRTTWNGSAWSQLTALTVPRANAYVSDIYVQPANLNRIWVTHRTLGGGRVWRSDNGGASWIDRTTAGLPNLPINAFEVDSANANRVWVAADLGVYQSTDGGGSWTNFSASLPNMYVGDLSFHPHARVLRAGTRNRGVWEIPVDGWMTSPQCGVQFTGTLIANETKRWFSHSWPAVQNVLWTVMPLTTVGPPQVSLSVAVERSNAEFVTFWLSVRNLTAVPVTFEVRYCILSRY
ncbi:MAG TPA: hypothetical protein VGQ36_01605 [Thermoanaerobaculia bacterium]|jgi:hypothetical protein|nr:hypothetical protein [Thermoanaerobaculia bacterium]